jgi:hypothetical protein
MGMLTPLQLKGIATHPYSTPVVSSDGTLYAPRYGAPDVLVFSADGTPLPSLSVASFGLSLYTCEAAFDADTATLLLADECDLDSKLVAVDEASRVVRWKTGLGTGLGGSCYGIAVLPAQGLVISSVYDADELGVHRIADGALVTTTPIHDPSFVAADPATATLYVSTGMQVSAFRWNGSALVSEGVVGATGDSTDWRPLAVVLPAPGQRTSYGTSSWGQSTLPHCSCCPCLTTA